MILKLKRTNTSNHKKTNYKKRITGFAVALFLTALLITQAAGAQGGSQEIQTVDPIKQSGNYSAVLYNNTNGLPTSEANDIVQTEEGFIWIGSYGGLIRYDGKEFERMDSTTGVGSVECLFVDSRNRLWIGTNDNGVALMEQGEFRIWNKEDGLGSDKISCISEGSDGTIYVGSTAGIVKITPDLTLEPIDDPMIAAVYAEQMDMVDNGILYCTTNEDDLFVLKDGELAEYYDHEKSRIQGITCVLPDKHSPGDLYIATEDSRIYHGDLKNEPGKMRYVDIKPLSDVIDMKQYGDQIWICARNGIGMMEGQDFHYLSELPMNNSINNVMSDYEGNLWFTSSRQGVMKVVVNQFTDVFERLGLESRVVNTTCMFKGKLFIGTDTGLIVTNGEEIVDSIPLTKVRTTKGESSEANDLLKILDGCRIRSIICDSQDRLWISTWRGRGLLCYDQDAVTVFTEADGLFSDHIRTVSETKDGALLVACTGGVNVIEGNRVTAGYSEEAGIANLEILSVCAAPNGDIVLGTNGAGIYVINESGTRQISKKDGMSSEIVMRIKYDSKRDLYWIVTSNSIAYMTSDYQVTSVQNFPYSNNFDLYENSEGDMWILSSNGIYAVPAEELIANKEIRPIHYDMTNGLPYITTSNSYSELTKDGDLYISGNAGVAKVNINSSLEKISELKMAVPYIEADGILLYPDEKGSFKVPAKVKTVTIYPYVFNYSLNDPKVSYYLEGFDDKATTVSRSELDNLTYTNLRGGSYRFVMELTDAMGRGSKTLDVSIVKEKRLYERPWFYIVAGLAIVLLLQGMVRKYVHKKTREMEVRHREAMDKERLNTELQTANAIQVGMLPHTFPPFPERTEFDIYAFMDPAREVGGDFYDFYLVDEDHLCLVIADVSGKGIPAALFMMVSKAIIKNTAKMGKSAGEVLTRVNELICSNNQMGMFVTVWLGILEISTGRITAANAGHEYPTRTLNGKFTTIRDQHGLVIGGFDGARYSEYEIRLRPGDKLFVYTDGVPEATDAGMQMFGTERMLAALNSDPAASPKEILDNVHTAVEEFVKDAEQFDDLTMLCLEYKGKEG